MELEALTIADVLVLGYVLLFLSGIVCVYQILKTTRTLLDIRMYKNEIKNLEAQRKTTKQSDDIRKIEENVRAINNTKLIEVTHKLHDSVAILIIVGVAGLLFYSVMQVAQH